MKKIAFLSFVGVMTLLTSLSSTEEKEFDGAQMIVGRARRKDECSCPKKKHHHRRCHDGATGPRGPTGATGAITPSFAHFYTSSTTPLFGDTPFRFDQTSVRTPDISIQLNGGIAVSSTGIYEITYTATGTATAPWGLILRYGPCGNDVGVTGSLFLKDAFGQTSSLIDTAYGQFKMQLTPQNFLFVSPIVQGPVGIFSPISETLNGFASNSASVNVKFLGPTAI